MRLDGLAGFRDQPGGAEWLDSLPGLVDRYVDEWELRLGEAYGGGSGAYVVAADTSDGQRAVLKLGWPHREAKGEAEALRWWAGNGAVLLLRHDPAHYALLLERCDPGVPLTEAKLSAEERLTIGAELLAGLWDTGVPTTSEIERLADVTAEWADLAEERMRQLAPPYDPGLVAYGSELLRTLPATASREVVVHGDFNPGNVLLSNRQPWLAIDAKPMIGDPGYDPCPLLMQVDEPFAYDEPLPILRTRIELLADILDEAPERLVAWSLARMVESALWYADRGEIANGSAEMKVAADVTRLL